MHAGQRWTRLVAVPLGVFIAALVACGGSTQATVKPSSHSSAKASPTPTPPVTFPSKYASIRAGMTVDQVRAIMGSQGSTLSQADNGAGTSSVVILWEDPKASSHQVIVDFINNMMESKSAIGF